MIDHIDDEFNKQQYESHIADYLSLNQDQHVGGGVAQTRVAFIQKYLTAGSRVFEIGSGGGVDALALQAAGYAVKASDYLDQFVAVLKIQQLSAMFFDAKQDDIPENYNLVYANAVFVHFTPEAVSDFLARIKTRLTGDRLVYFSVIQGEGKERRLSSDTTLERDFQYFLPDQLRGILADNGYAVQELRIVDGRWIQVIAQA